MRSIIDIPKESTAIHKITDGVTRPPQQKGAQFLPSRTFDLISARLSALLPGASALLAEVEPMLSAGTAWCEADLGDAEVIMRACLRQFDLAPTLRMTMHPVPRDADGGSGGAGEPRNCCLAFHASDPHDQLVYIIGAVFSRPTGKPTPSDVEILSSHAAELAEIIWRAKSREQEDLQLEFGSVGAESSPWAIVALAASGRVSFMNRRARSLLSDNACLRLQNHRLHFTRATAERRFQAMLDAIARPPAEGDATDHSFALSLVDCSGKASHAVRLMRHRDPRSGPVAAAAIAYITDLHDRSTAARAVLAATFSLSVKEAELAELFAGGEDLDSAAQHMGISRNTARIHLSHVLGKTGARNQVRLARILARMPADAGLPRQGIHSSQGFTAIRQSGLAVDLNSGDLSA
jgi:DNA-binding CsgD family transcriptional regulator